MSDSSTLAPHKLTPLHDAAIALGAEFGEAEDGWLVADVYTSVEEEVTAARRAVAIGDVSSGGKLNVEGEAAGAILGSTYGLPSLAVGEGAPIRGGSCHRLRSDLFFLHMVPGGEDVALAGLTAAAQLSDVLVTVTDVTHGESGILLIGPRVTDLMNKLCGLDCHSLSFPEGKAMSSSFAKTKQLVIRRSVGGLPAFTLFGARSEAAYVWATAMEAGEELGIVPIGRCALATIG